MRKLVGYKLKEEKYREAAKIIADVEPYSGCEYDYSKPVNIKRLSEAGVLHWFEEVYEDTSLTDEKVKENIQKEIVKRYKQGQTVKCLYNGEICKIKHLNHFNNGANSTNEMWVSGSPENILLFYKDEWAEIIEEPEFKVGDIVVWEGSNFKVGRIQRKCPSFSDSWDLGGKHNSCSEKNLRHATEEEKKQFYAENTLNEKTAEIEGKKYKLILIQ